MELRATALLTWVLMQEVAVEASAAPRGATATEMPPAPYVVQASGSHSPHARGYSARHGWLLRSNSALGLGSVSGVPGPNVEHGPLDHLRFTTTNHVSIGYGWRPNWALTLDGFRVVIPHYPHPGHRPAFTMRVDAETLGLGLGSTIFVAPLSLHLGTSLGFAMSRIAGDSLTAPTHRGIGGLSFAGFELMRSQGIGVVLAAQVFGIVARRDSELIATRTFAVALGITYW